ncbi:hypothetical protein [Pseudomonas fluorescens]|uniref:Uncharacterized protein n=1 Tax=Pseudomonas fluorescens TaxID=294 RepID=A0A5E6W5F2_PSEFL|nr:hypothetical protein [Pseudomonas fluorescens]VVN23890.1 hypothetical protein PS624_04482 [Pseudomonas fluorescens]
MLSLKHPELNQILSSLPVGLLTARTDENKLILILKLSKEMILAAKITRGFRISFVPYSVNEKNHHALLVLFPDNFEEPLSLVHSFYENLKSRELLELFSQDTFQSYFFDEHNRELLACNSFLPNLEQFRNLATELNPGQESDHPTSMTFEEVNEWYSDAPDNNASNTFEVTFSSDVYPAITHFIDSTQAFSPMPGDLSFVHYSLERTEPGDQQELDILLLLKKIIPDADFYLNPVRTDTKKEFVDVLAANDSHVLFVQAKDSPNTESLLRTSIPRKASKTLAHLKKAVEQMKGAFNHHKKNPVLKFSGEQKECVVDVGEREVLGLIVVKELFAEDAEKYWEAIESIFAITGMRCLIVDYTELHLYSNETNADSFFPTLEFLHTNMMEKKQFIRARFN